MKPKYQYRRFATSSTISAILVMSLAAASSAFSATVTWDGGPTTTGTDLGLAENWSGDAIPSAATPDTALWDGTVTGPLALVYTTSTLGGAVGNPGINLDIAATQTSALNLDSGLNTGSIRINNITLNSGSGSFSLGNSSNAFNLTLGGAGGQTHTWSNNSTNVATVASDVTFGLGGGGTHTLALAGSGNWLINKPFAPLANNLNLLKTGTGIATLSAGGTLNGNNTNAHLPGSALMPMVVREGTLLLTGGTLGVTGEATIGGVVTNGGPGQDAKIQLDGGSLTVSSWLSVGRGNGIGVASSDLLLNNASTVTAGSFSAGYNGGDPANLPKGTITLNGTSSFTVTGNGAFNFAESTGSHMTMTLNGSSTVTAAGTATKLIGQGGTGVINVNNTSTLAFGNGVIQIGANAAAANGTLNINGGTVTLGTGGTPLAYVGYRNGTGTLTMTGGALTHTGELRIGGSDVNGADNGSGTLSVSGGSITTNGLTFARGNNNAALVNGTGTISGTAIVNSSGDVTLGYAGAGNLGKLTVSGGTLNVGTAGLRWLRVGTWDTTKGQLDITSGAVNLYTNSALKLNAEGTTGANVVNQSGGSVTFYSDAGTTVGGTGNVDLQRAGAAASNNTYNFNGGTLTTPAVTSSATTGTRTFNFNGGTLRAAVSNAAFFNLGDGTGVDRANVRNSGAIIDTNGFNVTVAQVLEHSNIGGDAAIDGGLTKLNAGNLTLTADNTYTGATLVSGGTLTLTSAAPINSSSGITINGSGAKLVQSNFNGTITPPITLTNGSFDGNGSISSLTVANAAGNTLNPGAGTANSLLIDGSLTFQGAATLNIQANGDISERYIEAGDTLNLVTPGDGVANGQVVVNASNSTIWAGGTDYPVVGYTSFSGALNDFVLGTVSGLSPRQTASLVNTGTAIALSIDGDPVRWTGAKNSNWTTVAVGAPFNWILPSDNSDAEFLTGDVVLFDDNAVNYTVNIAENVFPGAVAFNNVTDYTISSTGGFGIAGGTSLLKNGSGDVTISTINTYTGSTTINGGAIEITGTGSIASSSSINIGGSGQLILSNTNANLYANPITGAGAVTKQGAETLTLSGANTFTGNFTLDAGQLNLNSAGALGAGPGTININGGTLNNTSGGTINMVPDKAQYWNTDITFIGSNSLYMSNGQVNLTATRTVDVQANIFGTGAVVDAAAGYSLVKTGPGKLVLNGGDIDGNLEIQTGIVGINQDFHGAAPTGTGTLQNDGAVGTKWTFWYGPADVTSNVLIRNNDTTNTRQLGIVKRGSGTLTLTNASNVATGNLSVDSGRLVLNAGTYGAKNDDGSTVTNLAAVVGNTAAANGILEINGATVDFNNRNNAADATFRNTLNIGNLSTGAGAVKLTSGSLTTHRQLALGITGTAFGAMSQTGGATTVNGFLALGLGTSQGILNLTGGTFNQAGPVTNGAGTGSTGVMNIGGNATYNQTSTGDNGLWVAENGTATLNVSGTATLGIVSGNNGLQLGRNAAGVGTVNLLGGTVTVKAVAKGAGTGTLNFNGGNLAANATNTAFLTGLTNAYVRSGGGTIDNGGNAITIGQALLAPTGGGVNATGLTVSGGGYIDTPIVTITGDGTGATGVANIDSNGNLTSITITNPGIGYTNASVTLSGGGIGNTGNLGGAATIVTNSSGGMTFKGGNITTLTAVNTYTGNTTVESGSTLQLFDNAGLKFVPTTNGTSNKITGAGIVSLDGDFNLDLTGAAVANGNSWTLVDVGTLTESFGANFTVTSNAGAFSEASNVWTLVDGNNTWTFTEATGVLSLSVTAGSGYGSWAATNAPSGTADDDFDNDGVSNGVEYVLGGLATTNDSGKLPAVSTTGGNLIFTFLRDQDSETPDTAVKIEVGTTLAAWPTSYAVPNDPVVANPGVTVVDNGNGTDTITLTIPQAPDAKKFARLVVTVQ